MDAQEDERTAARSNWDARDTLESGVMGASRSEPSKRADTRPLLPTDADDRWIQDPLFYTRASGQWNDFNSVIIRTWKNDQAGATVLDSTEVKYEVENRTYDGDSDYFSDEDDAPAPFVELYDSVYESNRHAWLQQTGRCALRVELMIDTETKDDFVRSGVASGDEESTPLPTLRIHNSSPIRCEKVETALSTSFRTHMGGVLCMSEVEVTSTASEHDDLRTRYKKEAAVLLGAVASGLRAAKIRWTLRKFNFSVEGDECARITSTAEHHWPDAAVERNLYLGEGVDLPLHASEEWCVQVRVHNNNTSDSWRTADPNSVLSLRLTERTYQFLPAIILDRCRRRRLQPGLITVALHPVSVQTAKYVGSV